MKRYIDADALDGRLLRDGLMQYATGLHQKRKFTIGEIRGMLQNKELAPTADVAPVVLCKDCVYYETGKDYLPYCNHADGGISDYPKADDFCSYGEKMDLKE